MSQIKDLDIVSIKNDNGYNYFSYYSNELTTLFFLWANA